MRRPLQGETDERVSAGVDPDVARRACDEAARVEGADDLELAMAIAGGVAEAVDLWSSVVRHDPTGRRPVRLLLTARYEVWVIGWTEGQVVPLHDHGRSVGALAVVEGRLTESVPDRGGPARRTIGAGSVHPLRAGLIHEVANRRPEPATSIHVYAPPLDTMTHYDESTLEPVHVEHVLDVPLLPSVEASLPAEAVNRG